jgi:hypothetical protein
MTVAITVNQEQLRAIAYQDFLNNLRPLLNNFASGGYAWNFGYSYTDCLNRSVHSGIWTYPWFSSFRDFNPDERKVTLVFASSGENGGPTELSFITEQEISTAVGILQWMVAFAEMATQISGYQITVEKPIWLADEYSQLLTSRHTASQKTA